MYNDSKSFLCKSSILQRMNYQLPGFLKVGSMLIQDLKEYFVMVYFIWIKKF